MGVAGGHVMQVNMVNEVSTEHGLLAAHVLLL